MVTAALRLLSVGFAIGAGILVLLGYFFEPYLPLLSVARKLVLEWIVILAAVAVLVGIANLIRVHWNKVSTWRSLSGKSGSIYSLVTLVSLFLTILVLGFFGPFSPSSRWVFDSIIVPVEVSLLALLTVLLPIIVARFLRRGVPAHHQKSGVNRHIFFALIFFVTVIVMLVGTAGMMGFDVSYLADIRQWIFRVPVIAGGRGLLLGVALGVIASGLRVLIGLERPYEVS